jgi:ketosteroid isomerase-like protein
VSAFEVAPADTHALAVAEAAFEGLRRGAATGDWSGFTDLLTEDVRIMIPVPATIPDPPEGVLRGIDVARQLFGSHHEEQVDGVELTAKRVSANGTSSSSRPAWRAC